MTNIYLGIDYGRAHLGLAIAEHIYATPLDSLPNDHLLLANLNSLIQQHNITHIVIGIPTGSLVPEIKNFAKTLSAKTGLNVALHDETLTTHEATRQLATLGVSRAKKKNEHSYAAALILEDYLDSAKL